MLKRKIEQTLSHWKQDPDRKPLVIKGIRQCGKTSSVLAFAEQAYERTVYLNFFSDPMLSSVFSGPLDVDHIIMMLSALMGERATFVPGKTVLILDEIQHCPQARTALKFFQMDGRFDVIATGSLLGLKGYREDPVSVPVGYETVVEMYPLDFEEFLWANGITPQIVDLLRSCKRAETPVPGPLHQRMRQLLLEYTVVGGMPAAVSEFIRTRQLNAVLQIQRDLIASYKDDMLKYADEKDKPFIRECFESIPRQLSRENKKFQYSLIRKGSTAARFAGCLQWIEDAGIICRCYSLELPELPLDGHAIGDTFKVYMRDTGLFVAMLEDGTQFDILQGDLFGYKGAIFEELAADMFSKMGRKLYYYHKDSGLEIDFVMRYQRQAMLVQIKASTGNTKSAKTILSHPEKYHVGGLIKLGDYNVGRSDRILTLPAYMTFLLTDL